MNLLDSPLDGVIVGGFFSLLGGYFGVRLQARSFRKAEELKYKREILRRFAGNRHKWAGDKQTPEEPYTSLNEIFVVFADSPKVISEVIKFIDEAEQKSRFHDNSASLVKALADASGVDLSKVSDDFIHRPVRLRGG